MKSIRYLPAAFVVASLVVAAGSANDVGRARRIGAQSGDTENLVTDGRYSLTLVAQTDATWTAASAGICIDEDNGAGTVTLPAGCPYETAEHEPMIIIDGLPPGTTMELDATIFNFTCEHGGGLCSHPFVPGECEDVGGFLGGHVHCFEAALDLVVAGTGSLFGFKRHLQVPIELEVHTGPRNPGDPVQTFPMGMFRLQGELYGDPDFYVFRLIGGTDFGLPSPGQATLTELPSGDYAVESFFDVTYQIEFEGCPGSALDGYMGTTTATVRWYQGGPLSCCVIRGDLDHTGTVDIADILYFVEFSFGSPPGPAPVCDEGGYYPEADLDANMTVDIADLLYFVEYSFGSPPGPAPLPCPSGGSATGNLISYTGCKPSQDAKAPSYTPPNQDCLSYQYDGESVLLLTHINAGFNCCPTMLLAEIRIEDNVITIREEEDLSGGGCYCLCLYDLDYEFANLPPGEYRIMVIEPYLSEGDEALDVTIDISATPSDTICVDRSAYPWIE